MDNELSVIENELLACARKGRPVFLYGKNSIDRKSMVGEVAKETSSHFKYIDCSRMSGNDVYDNLAKSRILFGWVGLLFVDNLICEDCEDDTESYRKLAKIIMSRRREIDDYKLEEGDNYEDCRIVDDPRAYDHILLRLLVVYSEEYESFPNYFTRQFTRISLENKSKSEETAEIESVVSLKDKIPSGTKWTDIEMSLTDKEHKTIDISVSGRKPFTASCQIMGLESNHSHRPLKSWWVLMAFAIAKNNEIPSTGKKLNEFAVRANKIVSSNGKTLFSHIDTLRKALKTAFNISENPIPHSESKDAYTTLFRIKDKSYKDEYEKSIQDSKDVKCDQCDELIKKYDHSNIDDEGNYICYNCKGSSHDRLSNEGSFTNYPDDDEYN